MDFFFSGNVYVEFFMFYVLNLKVYYYNANT